MQRIYTCVSKKNVGQLITDLVGDLNRWNGEKPLTVTMQIKNEKRSLDQNALYFKWCQIIADETGNDKDDIHEFLKLRFLGTVGIEPTNGAVEYVPRSSKKLSVGEMSEYMTKIQAWAATDLAITLPSGEDAMLNSLEDR